VLAGCQSDRSESGQATKAKPSPVVQWDCGRGLVPPVTKNGLTVSLLAERSEPLDDDVWALWFRGRLTNRTDALVREARGTVTSSDENSVATRDQLYFANIPPGESVYSADLVRIEQRGSDRVDGCALTLGLATPPAFERTWTRGVELGTTLEVQLKATDADGDRLTFRATDLPDGVSLDGDAGKLTIVAKGEPRSFPIEVHVSDGAFEDSMVMDVALYEPGVAKPPAEPTELSSKPMSVKLEMGGDEVTLKYDPGAVGATANYGSCLSRVTDCAKTNDIGTVAACISRLERCHDNIGGKNCCAPACIDRFDALIEGGAPVMQAIQESFLEGSCQEGLQQGPP
jgi:hypothetical protein